MKFKFNNLTELLLTFNNEEKCKAYFEQQRWQGKIICPHCGHDKVYRTNVGFKCASAKCYKKFSVTVGSVFENTNIKLQKWFCAIYLATAHKKGISSYQLGRDIGVTQKTAWFMLHRIREIFTVKDPPKMSGNIQADETYIAGKTKNMHQWKQDIINAAGTGAVHANPVFGMISDGKVRVFPIPEPTGKNIKPIIYSSVEKGSSIVTDGHGSYAGLHKDFKHEVVNHENQEYSTGAFHTNGIENFWSHLKRTINGTYHHISGKHLGRYCDECAYRYNLRNIEDSSRFANTLTQTEGRITYKQLTKKDENQSSI